MLSTDDADGRRFGVSDRAGTSRCWMSKNYSGGDGIQDAGLGEGSASLRFFCECHANRSGGTNSTEKQKSCQSSVFSSQPESKESLGIGI
jgi:hypothetical protein